MSCEKATYWFRFDGTPQEYVATFRQFYGPTMNAFDAAAKNGKEDDLRRELEELFTAKNESTVAGKTAIPATFLRVTVNVK